MRPQTVPDGATGHLLTMANPSSMILGLVEPRLNPFLNLRISIAGSSCAGFTVALVLAGCASDAAIQSYVPQIVTPYRIDIQQGNFITQEMVEKLAVGQTRDQVRFILGTPLLVDIFRVDRWDYVFRFSKGWNEPERRKLVVYFNPEGRVVKWQADVPPTALEPAAKSAVSEPAAKPATTDPPAKPETVEPPAKPGASLLSVPETGSATASACVLDCASVLDCVGGVGDRTFATVRRHDIG